MTLHAAEVAHVAPWDLEVQPMFWQAHILEKSRIESEVTRERQKRAERQRARQGRR